MMIGRGETQNRTYTTNLRLVWVNLLTQSLMRGVSRAAAESGSDLEEFGEVSIADAWGQPCGPQVTVPDFHSYCNVSIADAWGQPCGLSSPYLIGYGM